MTEVDGRALNTSESDPAQVSIPFPPTTYDLVLTQTVVGPPGPQGPPGAPPLITADTTTIDLTGAGVTGDPLTADVKAGSVGITATDTATIDFAGAGTAASPLTADVKPNSVGIAIADTATIDMSGSGTAADPLKADILAVKIADTASIDMSGSGTVADPLKAAIIPGVVLSAVTDTPEVDLTNNAGNISAVLTGKRVGGQWEVPDGQVLVGRTDQGPAYTVRVQGLIGVDVWTTRMGIASATMPMVFISEKNAVEICRLSLSDEGWLQVRAGGQYRPYPFATYVWQGQITITSASTGSITVTYPASRFTSTSPAGGPATFVTPFASGASAYSATTNTNSNTSTQITLRHINDTVATATIWVSLFAAQMTPTKTYEGSP